MKRLVCTCTVLLATFGWLAALFAIEPFKRVNNAMDRAFGALPAWTQVEQMHRDAETQEVSRGDRPLESFRALERIWAARPDAVRVVLMGNSQTQMTSLAPGEAPPSEPEKTYTDLIAGRFRAEESSRLFYRLSAGALSYQEMLWYAAYLASKPTVKPHALIVQLNYQNFANGGIRHGLLDLLSDPVFRQTMEQVAQSGRPDSDAFVEALRQHDSEQRAKSGASAQQAAAPVNIADVWETGVRQKLDGVPGFGRRSAFKSDFVYMLYRCRSYVLRLQPATRRSIGGIRLTASRAALDHLLEFCGRAGIRVILFHAPINPATSLYGSLEDDRSYHEFAASLSSRHGVALLDFEHSIAGRYWGMALNVPDPLHLGRDGHRILADLMAQGLRKNGI